MRSKDFYVDVETVLGVEIVEWGCVKHADTIHFKVDACYILSRASLIVDSIVHWEKESWEFKKKISTLFQRRMLLKVISEIKTKLAST